jgi:hypothetical protein
MPPDVARQRLAAVPKRMDARPILFAGGVRKVDRSGGDEVVALQKAQLTASPEGRRRAFARLFRRS